MIEAGDDALITDYGVPFDIEAIYCILFKLKLT